MLRDVKQRLGIEQDTEDNTWTKGRSEYLEEYMVLNMKMGNGKLGRIEN
jgi:hypothetical protein